MCTLCVEVALKNYSMFIKILNLSELSCDISRVSSAPNGFTVPHSLNVTSSSSRTPDTFTLNKVKKEKH